MTNEWKEFFESYRNRTAATEEDLFKQVGRTVAGRRISQQEFARGVERIVERLQLHRQDVLFEFCCGNGLLCYDLAPFVSRVIGIDFTEHLITTARELRATENIEYHVGDALEPIVPYVRTAKPTKYLMGSALSHFDPAGLTKVIEHVLDVSPRGTFLLFLTGIPDSERKWNFYNSPERRARYLENERMGSVVNDGMGRWWSKNEIIEIARRFGLAADVQPEPPGLPNYRMEALIG